MLDPIFFIRALIGGKNHSLQHRDLRLSDHQNRSPTPPTPTGWNLALLAARCSHWCAVRNLARGCSMICGHGHLRVGDHRRAGYISEPELDVTLHDSIEEIKVMSTLYHLWQHSQAINHHIYIYTLYHNMCYVQIFFKPRTSEITAWSKLA